MPTVSPCLIRSVGPAGDPEVSLGVPLLDEYLGFLSGRCRPNTVLAVAYDLKVFFTVVGRSPKRVRPADVLAFMTAQRTGHGSAAQTVQPIDGERVGVSTRTLRRRLSSVSGLYAFLHARGDVATNPVPRGLPTRRERHRPGQGVPLVRGTRTLPRILTPSEVDALTSALRSHRDRAMVAAMVLGGLRRCEVIGLRLSDLRVSDGCSSPRVRAATNVWCRSQTGSSSMSPLIWRPNVQPAPAPSSCSWSSNDRVAGSR